MSKWLRCSRLILTTPSAVALAAALFLRAQADSNRRPNLSDVLVDIIAMTDEIIAYTADLRYTTRGARINTEVEISKVQ
jgi:hypothetical protein